MRPPAQALGRPATAGASAAEPPAGKRNENGNTAVSAGGTAPRPTAKPPNDSIAKRRADLIKVYSARIFTRMITKNPAISDRISRASQEIRTLDLLITSELLYR